MALPDRLSGLLDERAYPHACPNIELIETHISWIILTGDFAYKLKKPVHFNFIDFSSLALREHFCREEVRCNRAFASELYLGVVGVVVGVVDGRNGLEIQLEPSTDVLEWAVRMRQFDPAQGLDVVLARGELEPEELRQFGVELARRHALLPQHLAERKDSADEVAERIFGPVEDNFQEIATTGLADRHSGVLTEALAASRSLGTRLRADFAGRLTGGAIRECHGDLHLSNLARIDGVVTAFDCLEFNENLRWIDVMSDVAFLFMDCHYRGEIALAYQFLDGYLGEAGDYEGVCLLHYFAAYRSVVRAKVAALRWEQSNSESRADEAAATTFAMHLGWARDWLKRPPGDLILTCGLSGSGKSHLSGRLLGRLPAIRLRSDVARKKLAGIAVLGDSQSPVDDALYSAVQSDRTFDHLLGLARNLLLAGERVIVDATFIERGRREQFNEMAAEVGVPITILYCEATDDVLQQRLQARSAAGLDPSEATLEVLALQQERLAVPGSDERVIRVDMNAELTDATVARVVQEIASLIENARPGRR